MKEKFILIVPLSIYKQEEAKLVTEAVMKIIEDGGALAVYASGQYGLWQDLIQASKKARVPCEVSRNSCSEKQFLEEDTIKYLKKIDRCSAKVGLVSMEYCSERLHTILTDAHRQNIDSFSCSLLFKTFVVKTPFNLTKIKNYFLEFFKSAGYNWSRNEM